MSTNSIAPKPVLKEIEQINSDEKVEIQELTSMVTMAVKIQGVAPFSEKPLVCVSGSDRPPLVAEYQGAEVCGYAQAQKLSQLAYGLYNDSCEVPHQEAETHFQETWTQGRLDSWNTDFSQRKKRYRVSIDMNTLVDVHPFSDFPIKRALSKEFNFQPVDCGEGQFSIPVILHNFGLLNPEEIHPFFNIVFHLNADQLHDFRSAESFKKVAEEMGPTLQEKKVRQLKVAYPASSSHLAPLVVAFHLIDQQVLDQAKFSFSEIDLRTPKRVGAYLELMAQMKVVLPGKSKIGPLITNLKKDEQYNLEDEWIKTVFTFKYKGKIITLEILNNLESKKHISDQVLKDSNLLVIHDLEDFSEEKRLLKIMEEFHGNRATPVPAWMVRNQKPESTVSTAVVEELRGKFGCGSIDSSGKLFGDQTWSVKGKGPEATLKAGLRDSLDPFDYHFAGIQTGPIKIHYKQEERPFYLTRWE